MFISEYPNQPYLKQDIKYVATLKKVAQDNGLKVIPIYDQPVDEPVYCNCKHKKTRSCLQSARGVYVNFIRFNDCIIMPEYTLPQNSKVDYNKINKRLLESEGFNVLTINSDVLAKLGGSLHCISWQC